MQWLLAIAGLIKEALRRISDARLIQAGEDAADLRNRKEKDRIDDIADKAADRVDRDPDARRRLRQLTTRDPDA